MRAPDAVVANRRSAGRHWSNDATIRLRDARVNIVVNRHQVPSSRNCQSAPRAGVVNARRPGHGPGRSEAESIDDPEHGASIIGAMVAQLDLTTETACVLQAERLLYANRLLRNAYPSF